MTRNYIPKHKTPFLPFRWKNKFDRHNFYWACHFSRRYHRLKNKERYDRRIRAKQEIVDWWIEFGSEMGFHEWYKRWDRAYRKIRKELRR